MRGGWIRSSRSKTPFNKQRVGQSCGAAQRQYPVRCTRLAESPDLEVWITRNEFNKLLLSFRICTATAEQLNKYLASGARVTKLGRGIPLSFIASTATPGCRKYMKRNGRQMSILKGNSIKHLNMHGHSRAIDP